MELREYRFELGLSQKEASIATGVPLRTYIRYENDNAYGNQLKRKQMIASLVEKYQITEEKGILKVEYITKKVETVLVKYGEKIIFCYLFGSYAKGYANDFSDVDLCVSTTLTGLSFVGLVEELHQALNKKVDVIRLADLKENVELVEEIMKDGIKIYG